MEKPEYLDRLKFEHDLINRRISWLLTSQSILYAAYGLAGKAESKLPDLFFNVVAFSGLAVSSLVLVGVIAAALAKWFVWRKYIDESGDINEPWGGIKTWTTVMGLFPDFFLPLVFIGGWSFLLWCK